MSARKWNRKSSIFIPLQKHKLAATHEKKSAFWGSLRSRLKVGKSHWNPRLRRANLMRQVYPQMSGL